MSYHPIIGLEVHVQLNTVTKLFCRCLNEYTPNDPNKNICVFCTGQPGALPVLNKETVKKSLIFGVAVSANIPEQTRWDRKNYFYPDLPAGYQISQYDNPIVEGGKIEIYVENEGEKLPIVKTIELTRAHLEADAGKSLHVGDKTLVDFNRSGCPLLEIVSEPQIRSNLEAMSYVNELQLLVRTLEISDADMEKGQMRFDCNISLQTEEEFKQNRLPAYKVEVKNINSVRALGRAIEYEIIRQTNLLEQHKEPEQETRGWRDDLNKSISQRSKENAHDYRYFPEPDLQILKINREDLPSIENLPPLPKDLRKKYFDLGLNLKTANIFLTQKPIGDLFNSILDNFSFNKENSKNLIKVVANILTENLQAISLKNNRPISEILTSNQIVDLAKLFESRDINNQGLIKAIEIMISSPDLEVSNVVKENDLIQVNDDNFLIQIVEKILKKNPKPVEEYKSGKTQVIGFLIGQAMKLSKGKGNPQRFKELILNNLK